MAAIAMMLTFGMMTLQSCTKKAIQAPGVYPEGYAFKENEEDDWGLMTVDGKVLFSNRFSECPEYPYEGRFFVYHLFDGYKLYTMEKEPRRIGKLYDDVTHFSQGLAAVVREDSPVEVIDKEGNVKFELDQVCGKQVTYVYGLGDRAQVFKIKTDDKLYGAVGKDGTVVIEPQFTQLLCSNSFIIGITEESDKMLDSDDDQTREKAVFSLFDGKGGNRRDIRCCDVGYYPYSNYYDYFSFKPMCWLSDSPVFEIVDGHKVEVVSIDDVTILTPGSDEDIISPEDDTAMDEAVPLGHEESFGIADADGNVIMEPVKVDALGFFFEQQQLIIFKKDDKYGLMDMKHNLVIPNIYDYLEGVDEVNGLMVAANFANNEITECKLINLQGKEVIDLGSDVHKIGYFNGSVIPIKINDEYYLMDRKGHRGNNHYSTIIEESIAQNSYVRSDKKNVEAAVDHIGLQTDGLFGITIDTPLSELLETMNNETSIANPDYDIYTKNIIYGNIAGKFSLKTHKGLTFFMEIAYEITNNLFQALTDRLRGMGKVVESNDEFFEVLFDNGNRAFVCRDSNRQIHLMLAGKYTNHDLVRSAAKDI